MDDREQMGEAVKDFELIGVDKSNPLAVLLYARCCTSFDDEKATACMNRENPTGISSEWRLCTDEHQAPVACEDAPETHRHLMFAC